MLGKTRSWSDDPLRKRLARQLSAAVLVCVAASQGARAESASLDALIAAAKAEGSVMIYHTSAVATFKPVFTAFAQKYGIPVRNFYATGAPLSVRFASEIAAGTIQADVF